MCENSTTLPLFFQSRLSSALSELPGNGAPNPGAAESASVPGLDALFSGLETATQPGATFEKREGTAPNVSHRGGVAFVPALTKHSCCRCSQGRGGIVGEGWGRSGLTLFHRSLTSLLPATQRVQAQVSLSPEVFPSVGAQASQDTCVSGAQTSRVLQAREHL